MRTIVAGSRTITNIAAVFRVLDRCPWEITVLIHGAAKGVDSIGRDWANFNGVDIEEYPADWDKYGKAAGPMRNLQMVAEGKAGAVVVVWDGESRGSKDMIDVALANKLHLLVVVI